MSTDSTHAGARGHGRDALTDALNRQRFLELLAEEKRLADSTGREFVVCLFDIDGLRALNDDFGHSTGDSALRALAERVRCVLDSRPWSDVVDLLARFDGGALIVFLRGSSLERGVSFAETVRAAVAAVRVEQRLTITVSAGVAGYRVGETLDRVLARGEQSLHLAKQFGRDRVEAAAPPPAEAHDDNLIPFPRSGWRADSKAC